MDKVGLYLDRENKIISQTCAEKRNMALLIYEHLDKVPYHSKIHAYPYKRAHKQHMVNMKILRPLIIGQNDSTP